MAPGLLFGVPVEVLFKRHFWLVHLLFIFAVAWLVMRTANAFIEAALLPLPTGRSGPVKAQRLLPMAALNLDRVAKALGLPVPKPEPLVQEPTTPVVDQNAAPVHTTLRVKLLGTLVSENMPEWSVASIQDVVTLKTNTYMIGDRVQGAEVMEIERLRVIVINNNRREFIDATPGDMSGAPPPPAPVISARAVDSGPPPSVALGASVKQISDNDYEIPRAEIDKTLANLNDVAMQARIVPAFKDGVAQGFKLFSIRPDSIYSKIGIQNGDVIKRINGFDLNSPEKALEIYSKLKESSRIDIEVERNGAAVRKTYNVK
ncbi:MAG: type II secretion system protein GspC [Archangium sp.]|nr:type II secretion system protein GspC [Archangium sp.]MDP3157471.1 type II secretion system protein GspC [Archangium sp.]MDP3572758.1 type II secretion system protein GspC [Archangium sp.]